MQPAWQALHQAPGSSGTRQSGHHPRSGGAAGAGAGRAAMDDDLFGNEGGGDGWVAPPGPRAPLQPPAQALARWLHRAHRPPLPPPRSYDAFEEDLEQDNPFGEDEELGEGEQQEYDGAGGRARGRQRASCLPPALPAPSPSRPTPAVSPRPHMHTPASSSRRRPCGRAAGGRGRRRRRRRAAPPHHHPLPHKVREGAGAGHARAAGACVRVRVHVWGGGAWNPGRPAPRPLLRPDRPCAPPTPPLRSP